MLIHLTKFIHVLLALSLLITTFFCLASNSIKNHKLILILSLVAAITGTLLVYPAHFTFHTPWIKAAYVLLGIFTLVILGLMRFKLKKITLIILLAILLIFIIHDAVTKTTLLKFL
jgi:hypothetical protein